MSGESPFTIVGNLVADPELRYLPNGTAVATFVVASTPRTYDKQKQEWVDGSALFMRCQQWREPAENVAESLAKGMRVIVVGRLTQNNWTTKEGDKRSMIELQVDEVGPALRYATAKVTRASRGEGGGSSGQGGGDAWGSAPASTSATRNAEPGW